MLEHNPADGGTFTFADADALNNLPYMSALRVAHDGHAALLYKRDIGYGQGPGQLIENGQPYRLDVWWQAARSLAITKSAVQIALAPATGAAAALEELPEASAATSSEDASEVCPQPGAGESIPLPLVPGTRTRILPSGLAAAGEEAPTQVKQMVAAGNRLYGTAYLYGAGARQLPEHAASPPMTAPPPSPTSFTGAAYSAPAPWTPASSPATGSQGPAVT